MGCLPEKTQHGETREGLIEEGDDRYGHDAEVDYIPSVAPKRFPPGLRGLSRTQVEARFPRSPRKGWGKIFGACKGEEKLIFSTGEKGFGLFTNVRKG